tara:strand:+ start:287 stop:922 length:636 start_codon:yes stop_codon:yes gene_type:complete
MAKICKLFLSLSFLFLFTSNYVQAKSGDSIVYLGMASGDGDIKLSGTTYSVDTESTTLGGITYLDGNIYLSGSISSGELTLAGIEIDSDVTRFGGGYYEGDLDYRNGTGEQFMIGVTARDVEVSLGSVSSSETYYSIGFDNSFGLGDGLIFGFGYDTDTEDLFSDNSYYGALMKAWGSTLVSFTIGYSKSVTDANNSSDSTSIGLRVGGVF